MIEHVKELVEQQYISAGGVYSILEERILKAIRQFRWDTPDALQQKVQAVFPQDQVHASMREVVVVRLRQPQTGLFRFVL